MASKSTSARAVRKKQPARKKKKTWKDWLRYFTSFLTSEYYDFNLLAAVILLTSFGLVMLYSTSAYKALLQPGGDDMAYFGKQMVIGVFSLLVAVLASNIDYHDLARVFSTLLYAVSLFLLFITKFIGREVNGARRWIYIGSVSFQPAELAKLAIILFLPYVIVKMGRTMRTLRSNITVLIFGAITSGMTFYFTENLSTAIIIACITVIMIFVACPKTKEVVLAGIAAGICAAVVVVIWFNTSSGGFRAVRIRVWLNPEKYASEGGYQIMQALYAIGSGGFFGKGLGKSTQKLGAIPEAQNDMIFSIICEELGVFGAALVMLLFVFLLYRLYFIAKNAPDLLGSLIVTGIFAHIAIQVVFNIAVVTNLFPTTGITLPFISYGGTSIMFLMAEMSLALGVSRQIRFQ